MSQIQLFHTMKFSAYRLVLLLAALLCVAGCRPSTHYVTVEGSVLGTTFRIKARTSLLFALLVSSL